MTIHRKHVLFRDGHPPLIVALCNGQIAPEHALSRQVGHVTCEECLHLRSLSGGRWPRALPLKQTCIRCHGTGVEP